MRVLTLPVSGGGFPVQIAALIHLSNVGDSFDVILSSSGGNVAAYLACAADWKELGILRLCKNLSSEMFLKSWSTLEPLGFMIGFFRGDIYNYGNGIEPFLQGCFTGKTIQKTEIWTGTYNESRQKGRIFCNRSRGDTILQFDAIDPDLVQVMEPGYCSGNISTIAKVLMASASIPGLVPSQEIDGENYVDGGIGAASPLILMQDAILEAVHRASGPADSVVATSEEKNLHIVYINSINFSNPETFPNKNVIDVGFRAMSNMVRTNSMTDRLAAYQLLKQFGRKLERLDLPCNQEILKRMQEVRNVCNYTFIEIYPTQIDDLDLRSFSGADIVKKVEEFISQLRCRIAWVSSSEYDDKIKGMLRGEDLSCLDTVLFSESEAEKTSA